VLASSTILLINVTSGKVPFFVPWGCGFGFSEAEFQEILESQAASSSSSVVVGSPSVSVQSTSKVLKVLDKC